jgi:hypothetical protein
MQDQGRGSGEPGG